MRDEETLELLLQITLILEAREQLDIAYEQDNMTEYEAVVHKQAREHLVKHGKLRVENSVNLV